MRSFLLAAIGLSSFLVAVEIIEGEALGGRFGAALLATVATVLPPTWSGFVISGILITFAFVIAVILLSARRDRSPTAAIRRKLIAKASFNTAAILLTLTALGSMVLYLEERDATRGAIAQLVFAGLLSGAVGFGELISRYRDDPRRLLGSTPTAIYVCVNMAAGIGALALVRHFGVFQPGDNKELYEVLLASFGAIAFFRTSFFTAKIGDADVGIGPSTLLKSLLDSSGMMTDREQAVARGGTIAAIMPNVDFEKAKVALPTLCFTLIEGLSPDQQRSVGEQIAKLSADPGISPDAKTRILGVYLVRQVGSPVLAQAVETLGDEITKAVAVRTDGSALLSPEANPPPGAQETIPGGTRSQIDNQHQIARATTWAKGVATAAWHNVTSFTGAARPAIDRAPSRQGMPATDPHEPSKSAHGGSTPVPSSPPAPGPPQPAHATNTEEAPAGDAAPSANNRMRPLPTPDG